MPASSPALNPAAANRLLEAARGHRLEYLFTFMLATGLRLGEALALRWCDVDLAGGSANVQHTLEYLTGRPWRIAEPKSASGKRVVPLIGSALAGLRAQRDRQQFDQQRVGEAWQDNDLVFPNALGTPVSPTNAYHEFKKLLARAGLPTTHGVHDLRHSTATYLLAAGVDGRIVMSIMGWSQVSMLKRYQHVLSPMLADAATRLEAVFPLAADGGYRGV